MTIKYSITKILLAAIACVAFGAATTVPAESSNLAARPEQTDEPDPTDTPKASAMPPATEVPTDPPPTQPVVTVLPPTRPPPPPTERPDPGQPTSPPPEPTSPPPAPPPGDDDDDDPPQQPPPAPVEPTEVDSGLVLPTAFRTPRPTRTPKFRTPTPTPQAAGSLRVVMLSKPSAPPLGDPFEFEVRLENMSNIGIGDITLDLLPSANLQLAGPRPEAGRVELDGRRYRWIVRELVATGSTRLFMSGLIQGPADEVQLCAQLLSQGAPLEHCIALRPGQGTGALASAGSQEFDLFDTPAGTGARVETGGYTQTLQWLALILGMVVLGVWYGLRTRGAE